MSPPSVCAIMLTRDRPEMAARAVRCFERQTYPAHLIIWDQSESWWEHEHVMWVSSNIHYFHEPTSSGKSIGELRNRANAMCTWADIIVHWDDDDICHPRRIEEQVALLQESDAECVGYRECLFWRSFWHIPPMPPGEAWVYSQMGQRNYAIGASLCYWRSVWQARLFPDLMTGEDTKWLEGVKCIGPRGLCSLICTIHGGNTNKGYEPDLERATKFANVKEWTRVPEWDERVRAIVETA